MLKIIANNETEPKFTKAVVGYLVKDGKVLLGLRKKVSNGLGLNIISGVGGKVGDAPEIANESDEEALVRELEEEINVKVTVWKEMGRVKFIFTNKPQHNHDVAIYIVDDWEGEPQETEVIKPEWYAIDNLPKEQMWEDNLHWLPRVLSGEAIDETYTYGDDGRLV